MAASIVASRNELEPVVEDFLVWLAVEKGRSTNTLSAYRRDLLRYRDHLRGRGRRAIDAVDDDVIAFVHVLTGEGLAPSSVTRTLAAVRGMHRFLVAEEVRPDDPAADVEMPRVPRGLPKALTVAQVTSLIEVVGGNDPVARRDRAILETLYGTGVRISELVGMSLGDVDLHDGLVRVLGKGSKERIVPIGRHAGDALSEWTAPGGRGAMEPDRWARRTDSEAVFLNQRGSRLSRQGAWGVVRRYGDEVGLGDVLTPHVLRHSCATHMLDHGADIRTVQELLGHASISTTQIYTKVSTERLLAVYRAAHPPRNRGAGERAPAVSAAIHLTRRFFGALRPGGPRERDRGWVESVLSDAEYALWCRQYGPDRRHTAAVAREVERRLGNEATAPVLAAALLHDIGKIQADLGTWGRVIATVSAKVAGRETARLWVKSSGFTRRVGLYLSHPEIGADLLEIAGSDPLTVAWTAEHHKPADEWTVDPVVAHVLHDVDDD